MIEGLKVSDKLCPISGSPIVNVSRVLLPNIVNICWWKTCEQWHTDFTNLFHANHGYIELVKSFTCFTSNFEVFF